MKENLISFEPSYVCAGHYLHINGKYTGIVVNLHAYNKISEYKDEVDKQIKEFQNSNTEVKNDS